jgi:hypothetical protein
MPLKFSLCRWPNRCDNEVRFVDRESANDGLDLQRLLLDRVIGSKYTYSFYAPEDIFFFTSPRGSFSLWIELCDGGIRMFADDSVLNNVLEALMVAGHEQVPCAFPKFVWPQFALNSRSYMTTSQIPPGDTSWLLEMSAPRHGALNSDEATKGVEVKQSLLGLFGRFFRKGQ